MLAENKRIIKNTVVNYIGLLVNTVLGIFISRYVLWALGASDYGLYGVVGGLIGMLNVLSTAMTTTTRRFINTEMGTKNGNLNRTFNVCLMIHFGFAIFVLLLAETIGMYYIYNYLNVAPDKFDDAIFVFQVSTLAAVIGITNVPYQALVEAFERFDLSIGINIFNTVLKLLFVISLGVFNGNTLKIYAIGMSFLTVILFIFFRYTCFTKWKDLVSFKFYGEGILYKEILFFNNYTAIGALASISRTQGSMMIINYFFGTLVNAAFQIAYTIENYCTLFVNNIGRAAWPQITQSFSGGRYSRTIHLTECMSRYTILLTLLITIPLYAELEFIVNLWLKKVPEGALFFCYLTLIDTVVKSICGGTSALVQASGKIKWFQIIDSGISIMTLPISFILLKIGCPPETIIYLYIISSLLIRMVSFILLKRIVGFNIYHYVKNVYAPIFFLLIIMGLYIYTYIHITTFMTMAYQHIIGIIITFFITSTAIFIIGFTYQERNKLLLVIQKNTRIKYIIRK